MSHSLDAEIPPRLSLPTTVLVVDDDPAILRRVSRDSLRMTNLGILVADTLGAAADFLESDIPIGAVLVDLNFVPATHDESRDLHNGMDLLEYVSRKRENLPKYVLSVDAIDRHSLAEANRRGIGVQSWFDKMASDSGQLPPWIGIERDLIKTALLADAELRDMVVRDGLDLAQIFRDDRIAETIRKSFRYPRISYIQNIGKSVSVTAPIEVICWQKDDTYLARAPLIPLLEPGRGADAGDAIDDLAEHLGREFSNFSSNEHCVAGYATYLLGQLRKHLRLMPSP